MAEDAVDKALERLEREGMPTADDPATIALRGRLEREHLVRYDEYRGAYVLTQTGRMRLAKRHARPATGATVTPLVRRKAGDS